MDGAREKKIEKDGFNLENTFLAENIMSPSQGGGIISRKE